MVTGRRQHCSLAGRSTCGDGYTEQTRDVVCSIFCTVRIPVDRSHSAVVACTDIGFLSRYATYSAVWHDGRRHASQHGPQASCAYTRVCSPYSVQCVHGGAYRHLQRVRGVRWLGAHRTPGQVVRPDMVLPNVPASPLWRRYIHGISHPLTRRAGGVSLPVACEPPRSTHHVDTLRTGDRSCATGGHGLYGTGPKEVVPCTHPRLRVMHIPPVRHSAYDIVPPAHVCLTGWMCTLAAPDVGIRNSGRQRVGPGAEAAPTLGVEASGEPVPLVHWWACLPKPCLHGVPVPAVLSALVGGPITGAAAPGVPSCHLLA